MKKILILFSLLSFFAILQSCDKETIIPQTDLPSKIIEYTNEHFPSHTIIQSIKDMDGTTKTYDITLSEGISLEFNRKAEITQIDGLEQLPNSVIPSSILDYVATNYAINYITDWEIDGKNQQIELNNGLDLEFNMNGEFLRIDN